MDTAQQAYLDGVLRKTLDDARLSAGESRALAGVVRDLGGDRAALGYARNRAFELAAEAVREHPVVVLQWLRKVDRVLDEALPAAPPPRRDRVAFAPSEDCLDLLLSTLRSARRTLDVCVFTITDDRIASALADAKRRGVRVRIVTDDEKSADLGSDVDALASRGLEVRKDTSPAHMHHKFAVADDRWLVHGSYNWTRGANENFECLHATDAPDVVARFREEFERIWGILA